MSNGSTGVFMRRASFIAFTVGGMLILGPASDVWAQSGAGGTPRAGWYVGGGIGANWASDTDQEGWNQDPLCYPTDACFDADPVPDISGYRWRYDIDAAAGAVFEISTGLILDRTRLEFSLAQRKNSLDQMFRSITNYDGMAMEERRGSSVVSSTESSIDTLIVRTLHWPERMVPANKKKDPRYTGIYRDIPGYTGICRDMPGYSGMRPRRLRPMIVGVPPRVGAAYAGIGRRNCGSRLLIYQMAFKPRFPGVLGSLK